MSREFGFDTFFIFKLIRTLILPGGPVQVRFAAMTSRVGWCIRTTSRTRHIYDSSGEQLDIDLWRRVPLKNLSDFWLSFQSRYLSACPSDGFFSLQETSICAIDEQLPHRHNGIREVLQGARDSSNTLIKVILPFITTSSLSAQISSLQWAGHCEFYFWRRQTSGCMEYIPPVAGEWNIEE